MLRLNQFLKPLMESMDLYGPARERLALHLWAEVVGPHVARNTAAVAVRGGILFVRTASSAWVSELTLGFRHRFLEALNARLGEPPLKDIRFLPPPLPNEHHAAQEERTSVALRAVTLPAEAEERIERVSNTIEDEEARSSVESLMRHALRAQEARRQSGWHPCPGCGELTADGARCYDCRDGAARERIQDIRNLFLQVPWISASEMKVRIPNLELREYEIEKRVMLHGLRHRLQDWVGRHGDDSVFPSAYVVHALRYCMLRSGRPPHQLTRDVMQRVLGPELTPHYPFG